ncbi:putative E3 ubiquitin-protein ligase [Sesbania bispinosa]|nr:putative E3 ubiquitin-protein ligase [Sesbania bispinosa]
MKGEGKNGERAMDTLLSFRTTKYLLPSMLGSLLRLSRNSITTSHSFKSIILSIMVVVILDFTATITSFTVGPWPLKSSMLRGGGGQWGSATVAVVIAS